MPTSIKKLRQNTALVRYYAKLKRARFKPKVIDHLDDFSDTQTQDRRSMTVIQPCKGRNNQRLEQEQERCSTGWRSVTDENEKLKKCEPNPEATEKAELPDCDVADFNKIRDTMVDFLKSLTVNTEDTSGLYDILNRLKDNINNSKRFLRENLDVEVDSAVATSEDKLTKREFKGDDDKWYKVKDGRRDRTINVNGKTYRVIIPYPSFILDNDAYKPNPNEKRAKREQKKQDMLIALENHIENTQKYLVDSSKKIYKYLPDLENKLWPLNDSVKLKDNEGNPLLDEQGNPIEDENFEYRAKLFAKSLPSGDKTLRDSLIELINKSLDPNNRDVAERFMFLFDEVGAIMNSKNKRRFLPYPRNKKTGLIDVNLAYSDLTKIDTVANAIKPPSRRNPFLHGLVNSLQKLMKAQVLSSIVSNAIRHNSTDEFESGGRYYRLNKKISDRAIFSVKGEKTFLRNVNDPDAKNVDRYVHTIPEYLKEDYEKDPEAVIKLLDEGLHKLGHEDYVYTDNAADLFLPQFPNGDETQEGRRVYSSTYEGLKLLHSIVSEEGMKSNFADEFKRNIDDLFNFFTELDSANDPSKSLDKMSAQVRKVHAKRFHKKMRNLYETMYKISSEVSDFNGAVVFKNMSKYVTYLGEFQTSVSALFDADSKGVLVPLAGNYPLADVHKVVDSDDLNSIQVTFVSTKNGFGSNDSSLSAIPAVKYFGTNSYYRKNEKYQMVHQSHNPQKQQQFEPSTNFEKAITGTFIPELDSRLLKSEFVDGVSPATNLMPRGDINDGKGAEIKFRIKEEDTLIVRPGAKLALEEMYRVAGTPDFAKRVLTAKFDGLSQDQALTQILSESGFKSIADFEKFLKANQKAYGDSSTNVNFEMTGLTDGYLDPKFSGSNLKKDDNSRNIFVTGVLSNFVVNHVQPKLTKKINGQMVNISDPKAIVNTYKSNLYSMFPNISQQEMNNLFPVNWDSEGNMLVPGINDTDSEQIKAEKTKNWCNKALKAYLSQEKVFAPLADGFKAYNTFKTISGYNISYQYNNTLASRTKTLAQTLEANDSLNKPLKELKGNKDVDQFLEDLNSGLNIKETTMAPALRKAYESFVGSFSLPEIKKYIKVMDLVSASGEDNNAPLGTGGIRLLNGLCASLGMYNGDSQELLLVNSLKTSLKNEVEEQKPKSELGKHFKISRLQSLLESNKSIKDLSSGTKDAYGLYHQLASISKDERTQSLNMSLGGLTDYMRNDFLLDDAGVSDFKSHARRFIRDIKNAGNSQNVDQMVSELNADEVQEMVDRYIHEKSTSLNKVMTLTSPMSRGSAVTTYTKGKEESSNYAGVGLKVAPYNLAAYFAYLTSKEKIHTPDADGVNRSLNVPDSSFKTYRDTKEFLDSFNNRALEALKSQNINSDQDLEFVERLSNNARSLKLFYKKLLQKSSKKNSANLIMIDFYESVKLMRKFFENYADEEDGDELNQPCVLKNSEGKITGVSSYKRERACFNGWTSIAEASGKTNMCVPSRTSEANFKYPRCPKEPNDREDDVTMSDALREALKNDKNLPGSQELSVLLDRVGTRLLAESKKQEELGDKEKVDEIKNHLEELQALQDDLLQKYSDKVKAAFKKGYIDTQADLETPTFEGSWVKDYYQYLLFKMNSEGARERKIEARKVFKPSTEIPKIDSATLETTMGLGEEYINWVKTSTGVDFEHISELKGEDRLKFNGFLRNDILKRGSQAFKSKGHKLNEYYAIAHKPDEDNLGFSEPQTTSIFKAVSRAINVLGGMFRPNKMRIFRSPTDARPYHRVDKITKKPRINTGSYIEAEQHEVNRVLIHEIGHEFELQSKNLIKMSTDFILSKATGDLQKLSEITGNPVYKDHEVAYPGQFISPYAGKIYTDRETGAPKGTEIVSLGVEAFANNYDICDFFSKDPDHLKYIVGVLLSSYNTPKEDNFSEKSTSKNKTLKKYYRKLLKKRDIMNISPTISTHDNYNPKRNSRIRH